MAPRKTYTAVTRTTRSSTRPKTQLVKPESPKKKITKTQKKPAPKADKKAAPKPAAEAEEIKKVEENGDLKANKKTISFQKEEEKKTVIIEHCKQCNQFKIRALQVKSGLEEGVDGVNVVVNPEKPRRGCFEIREEGENGEKFVSLLEMKRPFSPMKALDMDQVISDIIEKIK